MQFRVKEYYLFLASNGAGSICIQPIFTVYVALLAILMLPES